jgi:hypothetical protein
MVVCRRVMARFSHPKSPQKFTQRQLMTLLVLKAMHDETFRGIITLLEMSPQLQAAIGLEGRKLPHFTTLQKFSDRVVAADPKLIDTLVGEVLAACQQAGLIVTEVAGDSTGVACSVASRHFELRAGRGRGRYIKLAVLVACGSLMPASLHVTFGPTNEMEGVYDLVWRASGRCQPAWAYYDAGFDSERLHTLHRDGWGVRSVIPPVPKTADGSIRTPHRASCRPLPGNYGRRWHVESFFSGLKRVCGSAVRAIKPANQLAEAAMKVLAYALRR